MIDNREEPPMTADSALSLLQGMIEFEQELDDFTRWEQIRYPRSYITSLRQIATHGYLEDPLILDLADVTIREVLCLKFHLMYLAVGRTC